MKYKVIIYTKTSVLEQEVAFENLYEFLQYLGTIPNVVDVQVKKVDTYQKKLHKQ